MATTQTPIPARSQITDPPRVLYAPSAHRLLTRDAQEVLNGLLPVLIRHIKVQHINIRRIEVDGIAASEELDARVIIALWVELPDTEALALWSQLGDVMEQWATTLPEAQAKIALDFLALDVEGNDRAGAV